MSRRFDVRLPLERAYTREVMLALELLDSVTLERITQGVQVTAKGLTGKPIVSFGGLFVWLKENATQFEKLSIEPGAAPFERIEIPAAQVARPLHRVELKPLANYPFAPGNTAIRGSLIESRPPPGVVPIPIPAAMVRLEWLDDDGTTWHPWQAPAVTNTAGDFISILRLARGRSPQADQPPRPDQHPLLDAQGRLTIRLSAKRATGPRKQKNFQLPQGRVADETYAWDEL
jgi:hypothetical protein